MQLALLRQGKPIPLCKDAPNLYSPVHEKDYIWQAIKLLEIAAVPPVVVNWCGSLALTSAE